FSIHADPTQVPAGQPSVHFNGVVFLGTNFSISLPGASIGKGDFRLDMPNNQPKHLHAASFAAKPRNTCFQLPLPHSVFRTAASVFTGPVLTRLSAAAPAPRASTIAPSGPQFGNGYPLAGGPAANPTTISAAGAKFAPLVNLAQGTYTAFNLSGTSFSQAS